MQQIKCPHCGELFTIDESNYNSIVSQIRDHQFNEELAKREKSIEINYLNKLDALKAQAESDYKEKLSKQEIEKQKYLYNAKEALEAKEKEIVSLQSELNIAKNNTDSAVKEKGALKDKELAEKLAEKDAELRKAEAANEIEINKLRNMIESLEGKLQSAQTDKENAVKAAKAEAEKNNAEKESASIVKITQLQNDLKNAQTINEGKINTLEMEKKLAVQTAIAEIKEQKDKEISQIRNDLDKQKSETTILLAAKDQELAKTQEMVEYYKDFKLKQSTKMIGESLEVHCKDQFDYYRMGMFPNAYFEKDNDARSGSKGDFIFREKDSEGMEFISIMFEMKNENDLTATKHKNEDFFKELDKDRKEKNCEYAVLVTMLESDSELYNQGIVDVSYKYPKMYVIRPQFFIPMITLLRNAAMNTVQYKKQLEIERNNNLDVTHFEENMEKFKTAFGKNYTSASKHFSSAIEEIDKSILHLQKIKDELTASDKQLRLANDKAQDLSIKDLTKNAPSVAQRFKELENK